MKKSVKKALFSKKKKKKESKQLEVKTIGISLHYWFKQILFYGGAWFNE